MPNMYNFRAGGWFNRKMQNRTRERQDVKERKEGESEQPHRSQLFLVFLKHLSEGETQQEEKEEKNTDEIKKRKE